MTLTDNCGTQGGGRAGRPVNGSGGITLVPGPAQPWLLCSATAADGRCGRTLTWKPPPARLICHMRKFTARIMAKKASLASLPPFSLSPPSSPLCPLPFRFATELRGERYLARASVVYPSLPFRCKRDAFTRASERAYHSHSPTRASGPPALRRRRARPLGGGPAFWRAINYSGAAAFTEKEKNAGRSATRTLRTDTLCAWFANNILSNISGMQYICA